MTTELPFLHADSVLPINKDSCYFYWPVKQRKNQWRAMMSTHIAHSTTNIQTQVTQLDNNNMKML